MPQGWRCERGRSGGPAPCRRECSNSARATPLSSPAISPSSGQTLEHEGETDPEGQRTERDGKIGERWVLEHGKDAVAENRKKKDARCETEECSHCVFQKGNAKRTRHEVHEHEGRDRHEAN